MARETTIAAPASAFPIPGPAAAAGEDSRLGADLALELEKVDFGLNKSIRYHSRRRARFEMLDGLTKWLTVVAGASAFAAIVGDARQGWAAGLTLIITGLGLADIIFSFSARARLHADLSKRFSELSVDAAHLENEPTSTDISVLRAKRRALEGDEPPIIDALERWCWNEEAVSRGLPPEQLQKLSGWQRFVARVS
jgi:hypothetical protein